MFKQFNYLILFLFLICNVYAQKKKTVAKDIFIPEGSITNDADIYSSVLSPDNKYLFTGDLNGSVKKWNLETKQFESEIIKQNGWVNTLAISKDGKIIVSGGSDNCIMISSAEKKEEMNIFHDYSSSINSLSFADDSVVIIASDIIQARNIYDGKIISAYRDTCKKFTSIAIHPSKKILACGTKDGRILIIDIKSFKLLHTLSKHKDNVSALSFSGNGSLLASGGYDSKIYLWNTSAWLKQSELSAHRDEVGALRFTPDNKYLASGSWDKVVLLWNLKTRKIESGITDHINTVSSITGFDDKLITTSFDKTIKIFRYRTK
jgi:WD40 repeat protein